MAKTGVSEKYRDEWIRLYNEGMSFRGIGDQYNVNHSVVKRAIKGHVKLRPKSEWDQYADKWYELYVDKGWTKSEIANQHGISISVVSRVLKLKGIVPDGSRKKHWHLAPKMKELYERGKSLQEIADELNLARQTILNYLNDMNVEIRSYSEAVKTYPLDEDYFDDLNEENTFVLGLLFGVSTLIRDQGVIRGVFINTKKKEIVDYIFQKLNYKQEKEEYYYKNGVVSEELSSKKIVDLLISWGFDNTKNMRPPAFNSHLLERFTEGYIYAIFKENQNNISFSADNPQMKNLVKDYLSQKFDIKNEDFMREREKYFVFYKKELRQKIGQFVKSLIEQ